MNLWRKLFFSQFVSFFIFQLKDQLVQRLTIQLLPLIKAVINFSSLYVNLTHDVLYISGVKCTKKKNHINNFFYKECHKWLLEGEFKGILYTLKWHSTIQVMLIWTQAYIASRVISVRFQTYFLMLLQVFLSIDAVEIIGYKSCTVVERVYITQFFGLRMFIRY